MLRALQEPCLFDTGAAWVVWLSWLPIVVGRCRYVFYGSPVAPSAAVVMLSTVFQRRRRCHLMMRLCCLLFSGTAASDTSRVV
jgi:hypothetical protein